MATIEERAGKFRVQLRKKGIEIYKTFSNIEDAELFCSWKEDIIDQMEVFDPDMKDLITLENAIDLKVKTLKETGKNQRTIDDVLRMKGYFSYMLNKSICEITYDYLLKKAQEMMITQIKHGGVQGKEGTGTMKLPSRSTILSRFNVLGGVYSNLISDGVNIENVPYKVLSYLKTVG